MNYHNVSFLASYGLKAQLPPSKRPEIAFAGRSNVGKSSLINKLLGRKAIARVSSVPGKTATINFFDLDQKLHLVDLPGYGYAKVSQSEKDRWAKLMENYFAAERIDFGVMIVDARHAPTANDITMAQWFKESGCPFVVVANKLDKLKTREIEPNMETIRQVLELPEDCTVIPFSAEKGTGKDALLQKIVKCAEGKL